MRLSRARSTLDSVRATRITRASLKPWKRALRIVMGYGGLVILLVACAGNSPAPRSAAVPEESQEWRWCTKVDTTTSLDAQIGGCTTVIQSGRETNQKLATALDNRGLAYFHKRDYDRATADLDSAIRVRRAAAVLVAVAGLVRAASLLGPSGDSASARLQVPEKRPSPD